MGKYRPSIAKDKRLIQFERRPNTVVKRFKTDKDVEEIRKVQMRMDNCEYYIGWTRVIYNKDGETILETIKITKDYLEEQSFLKMDVLGITNLTIIRNCLDRINEKGISLRYEDLPWEDKDSIALIASGKTMGIFQLESDGMKNAIKTLKPTTFEDVVALLALYRPGPMANIPHYAKRKAGIEKIPYLSNALKEILEPTYGIIVYQEQIMQIANKMAGFSMGQADLFRRAISKKKAEQLLALKESFINGCIKNGYSNKEATTVYDYIYKFADYGFNKSHSLVYAILSCQMAYLKKNYPTDFYASILEYNNGSSSKSFNSIITEIKAMGIKMSVPNINESDTNYHIVDKKLLFPLTSIKKLQYNNVLDIIREREENGKFKDFFEFVLRMHKYHLNNNALNILINSGAFDCFNKTRSTLRTGIVAAIQYAEAINDSSGQMIIDPSLLPPPMLRDIDSDLLSDLNLEYESLGYMISGSPLSLAKDKLVDTKITNIVDINTVNGDITIAGVIKNIKVITNKKGEQMAFITIYDDSGEMEITIFSDIYQMSANFLKKNEVIIVSGYYNNKKDKFNFSINSVTRLEDY